MEENFLVARETVLSKYGINHPYYALFVCALYGLFQKYKGYRDLIIKLFMETTIIIEEGTLKSIAERNNIRIDNAEAEGICIVNDCPTFDKSGRLRFLTSKNYIICRKIEHVSLLLNIFCHEFGHLIKASKKPYRVERTSEKKTIIGRTGLARIVFSYDYIEKRESETVYENVIFDEAINSLQTTEVMEEIVLLKEFIQDSIIKQFLDSVDDYYLIHDHGYAKATRLLKRLWGIDSFKRLIEGHIVEGDIEEIYRAVEETINNKYLEYLSRLLDFEYKKEDSECLNSEKRSFYMDMFVKIWRKRFDGYAYTYTDTIQD